MKFWSFIVNLLRCNIFMMELMRFGIKNVEEFVIFSVCNDVLFLVLVVGVMSVVVVVVG